MADGAEQKWSSWERWWWQRGEGGVGKKWGVVTKVSSLKKEEESAGKLDWMRSTRLKADFLLLIRVVVVALFPLLTLSQSPLPLSLPTPLQASTSSNSITVSAADFVASPHRPYLVSFFETLTWPFVPNSDSGCSLFPHPDWIHSQQRPLGHLRNDYWHHCHHPYSFHHHHHHHHVCHHLVNCWCCWNHWHYWNHWHCWNCLDFWHHWHCHVDSGNNYCIV